MSSGNVTDLRRVRVEHPSESWENEASGTGAPTPARTNRDLLCERRAAAVDATHEPPVCEPSRAVRHSEPYQFIPDPADVPDPSAMWIDHSADQRPGYRNRGAQVSAAKRKRIYERDGNRCVRCGATEDLTLDHIQPQVLGGKNADDNLRTLCRSCNSSKGAKVE